MQINTIAIRGNYFDVWSGTTTDTTQHTTCKQSYYSTGALFLSVTMWSCFPLPTTVPISNSVISATPDNNTITCQFLKMGSDLSRSCDRKVSFTCRSPNFLGKPWQHQSEVHETLSAFRPKPFSVTHNSSELLWEFTRDGQWERASGRAQLSPMEQIPLGPVKAIITRSPMQQIPLGPVKAIITRALLESALWPAAGLTGSKLCKASWSKHANENPCHHGLCYFAFGERVFKAQAFGGREKLNITFTYWLTTRSGSHCKRQTKYNQSVEPLCCLGIQLSTVWTWEQCKYICFWV